MFPEFDRQKVSLIVMTGFLVVPVIIFAFFIWNETSLDAVETGEIDKTCDLHKTACAASFSNGGSLVFSITPRPLKPLSPLVLNVELSNLQAEQVKVDFQGIGIDMGFYRPELNRDSDKRFSGEASLSVCTLDKMLWQATVIIKSAEGTLIAPFRFEVSQP